MASSNSFTCAACGNTYAKAWTDEEAMAESNELFPGLPKEEQSVVCDFCWEKIKPSKYPEQYMKTLGHLSEGNPAEETITCDIPIYLPIPCKEQP